VVDAEYLRSVELFQNLPEEELARLADETDLRQLRRGDVLFTEGDEPTELFAGVDGRIAMVNRSIVGRESVVALMESGDLFGEMPLFDRQNRSTDARALDSSQVLAIPYAPLQRLYETHPHHLWQVVRLLAGRLRVMDGVLADSVFLDVTGR